MDVSLHTQLFRFFLPLRLLLLLPALLGVFSLKAQIEVNAGLDSASILIGDQVGLNLRITHTPRLRVTRIDWSGVDSTSVIEVLERRGVDTVAEQESTLLSQVYVLTSFDSGYHRIPPIVVHYIIDGQSGAVQTNQLALRVRSFPVAADTARLEPIKTIIEEPLQVQDLLPYIGIALLVLLLVLLVNFLLRRRKKTAPPAPMPPRPAHEWALDQLKNLEAAQWWQRGEVKQYYSELTRVVREYLERRFQLPALESTTDEILDQIRKAEWASGWVEVLRKMLQTADLVKFAKAEPSADLHPVFLKQAFDLVEATREREAPEEEEGQEQNGSEVKPA